MFYVIRLLLVFIFKSECSWEIANLNPDNVTALSWLETKRAKIGQSVTQGNYGYL